MNPSFLAPTVGNSVPELGATIPLASSSNVFLTAASLGLQVIGMTNPGLSVFLPPSYSVVPGQTKITIKNAGTTPFGVRDSTGVLLTVIASTGSATMSLDNATNWSVNGTLLEPGLITVDGTFTGTFGGATVLPQYVVLDSNTSIHFLPIASGFAAFIMDNAGKVITTPVTVSALAGAIPNVAFPISPTTAMLFFSSGAAANRAVVLSVTGTSPNLSITVNTPALLGGTAATNWTGEDFRSSPKITQLTPTLYAHSWSTGAAVINFVAISVAGVTVTIGATATVAVTASTSNATTVWPINANTFISIYLGGATSSTTSAVIVTIAGTTCTPGTPAAAAGALSSTTNSSPSSCMMSATKGILLTDNNTNTSVASAITVSGNTVTFGATLTLDGNQTGSVAFTGDSASRFVPHIFPIGPNSAVYYVTSSSNFSFVAVISESGGVLTKGTSIVRSFRYGAGGNPGVGVMLQQGSTSEFLGLTSVSFIPSNPPVVNIVTPILLSGTSFVAGPSSAIYNSDLCNAVTANRLSGGKYVITAGPNLGQTAYFEILTSNGYNVTYLGRIAAPNMQFTPTTTPMVQAAISANRMVVLAVGSYGQTTSVQLTRAINLELVA